MPMYSARVWWKWATTTSALGLGRAPINPPRFHTLLDLRHVPEILLEHVWPPGVGRIGDELPLRLRLCPLRITFDHVGFEDTAIGVRAVRPRPVAQGVRDPVQDNTVREEMPVMASLLHVVGIDVRPDHPTRRVSLLRRGGEMGQHFSRGGTLG